MHSHPFMNSLQVKLALNLLENKKIQGGMDLDIEKSIAKGILLACFPLHQNDMCEEIANRWYKHGHTYPWRKPYHLVKDYFGEKVGLYYRFLGFYLSYLLGSSIVGAIMQIVVFATDDFSSPAVPFYSFFVVLWAVFFTEHWIRAEKTFAMQWGMYGYETSEADRPQFYGETIKSLVNGKEMVHFSHRKANELLRYSVSIIGSLILLVIGTTASVYVARNAMAADGGVFGIDADTIASVINSIQITIFNAIYSKVAKRLTDQENHRTNTEYEDAMIAKLFCFQFVNSFSSFFFIAFCAKFLPKIEGDAAENVGQCGAKDCMYTLGINLAIVLIVRLTVGNFQEFILPSILNWYHGVLNTRLSLAERQFRRPDYDFIQDSIDDYSELLIQFGYQTLFVTALPLSTLLVMINNHFQLRYDVEKMLFLTRRVYPKSAEDIGTWQSVFELMTVCAVPANAALVAFTMTTFDNKSIYVRFWLFIGIQWFVFTLQSIMKSIIPDVPAQVSIQLQRANFVVSKVIDHVPDDLDGKSCRNFTVFHLFIYLFIYLFII